MSQKRILILSTDTPHHRYFIREIEGAHPIAHCLFETTHVEPPFDVDLWSTEERAFEQARFFPDPADEGAVATPTEAIDSFVASEAVGRIRSLAPTFGIVFGTRRLPQRVLELFPDGLINVHRGITQKYRGLDSDLWAIYHRDWDDIGVTIHRVEPTLDTGEIVAQRRLRLEPGMEVHHLRYHTTRIATELVVEAVSRYLAGELTSYAPAELGRYYSFMPAVLKEICRDRFARHCGKLADKPSRSSG